MEIGGEERINFLDTTLIKKNGKIIFDFYKKPTNSGKYLHFYSNRPIEHKKGILNLFDRILLLSHPLFQTKNLEDINILINNGYPLEFIFSTINNRKQFCVSRIKQYKKHLNEEDDNRSCFTIPYVKNISEKFKSISKKHELKLAFSASNSFSKFIKTGKDPPDHSSYCVYDVVYQINCRDCKASYVGQTKRFLKTKIKEHCKNINKLSGPPSVISDHRLEFNHDFKWNEVGILDKESSWNKRIISEMIHIKKQRCGINK